jgi:hypothetical protein
MYMDAQGGGAPLTVEQMRDTVARLLEGLNSSDPREIAAIPRLVSAAAQAVRFFVESMESLPAEKGAELVAGAYGQLEGSEIAEAVNAFSRFVIRLHEQNPELYPAKRTGIVSDFMQATDFGKLRVAVTYRLGDRLELARREVELLGDNPMALINIFSLVAPLANDALQVLKALFDILALPAEAVTYALFKIIEDLEWQDVAAAINGLAAFIVNVHRGSLILGDGSLYTRGPLTRISSELVAGLDGQVLAEAIAAIGEEGEVLSTALASQVLEKEDLALPLAEAAISVANSSFRAAAAILEKANAMPQETISKMVAAMAEDLEVKELGRVLVSLVAFNRRVIAENPELVAAMSRETLSALELDMSPETLAEGLNLALASYNGWVGRNPNLVVEGVSEFLTGIDTQELERAAKATGDQVADALSRNPAVMKPLLKAAMSIVGGSVKGYVRGLRARRKAKGV